MISEKDLYPLLSQWEKRQDNSKKYSWEYRVALGECINNIYSLLEENRKAEESYLQDLASHLPPQEVETLFLELEADKVLSAHEALV